MARLKVEDFTLELNNNGHKEDDIYGIIISVSCNEYSGQTIFYVAKEQYHDFINNFCQLYNSTIECNATISEKDNNHNYLRFNSDGMGNITICGVFNNCQEPDFKFEKNLNKNHLKLFYIQLNYDLLGLS